MNDPCLSFAFDTLRHAEIEFNLLTPCLLPRKVVSATGHDSGNIYHQIKVLGEFFRCILQADLISGLHTGLTCSTSGNAGFRRAAAIEPL